MKRAHLPTGGLVVLSGAVLVGGAVWFLAGRGSEEAATPVPSSATATVATSPTATADASLSPTASPAAIPAINGPAVVFFRAPTLSYPAPFSELWISGLDGSGSRRLSPEGVKSTFAGAVSTHDRSLVY